MRPNSDRLYGFDLTHFADGQEGADRFIAILKLVGLSLRPIHDKENSCWVWANAYLKLVCANNPITGKCGRPKAREQEQGFASYIGIEGNPIQVKALATLIKASAEYIKDESPNERQFI